MTIFEIQKLREMTETHFKKSSELERKKQLDIVIEKLSASNYQLDHYLASEQRRRTKSGEWILQTTEFQEWLDTDGSNNPLLYVHGIPGAGRVIC